MLIFILLNLHHNYKVEMILLIKILIKNFPHYIHFIKIKLLNMMDLLLNILLYLFYLL